MLWSRPAPPSTTPLISILFQTGRTPVLQRIHRPIYYQPLWLPSADSHKLMIRPCRFQEQDTGFWRVGSAIILWNSWLNRDRRWLLCQIPSLRPWSAQGHCWVCWNIPREHCTTPSNWDWSIGMLLLCGIVHGTTDRVSHTNLRSCNRNWCNHWNWWFWALCCQTPCSRRVVLRSSYTDGIRLFPVVFLWWATAQYHHIQRLYYIALSGLPVVVRCHQVVCWRDWHCSQKILVWLWAEL